jgi:hypothetical protein
MVSARWGRHAIRPRSWARDMIATTGKPRSIKDLHRAVKVVAENTMNDPPPVPSSPRARSAHVRGPETHSNCGTYQTRRVPTIDSLERRRTRFDSNARGVRTKNYETRHEKAQTACGQAAAT